MLLLWQLFFVFARVALFSRGGGPASLALMQREAVTAGWVTPADFADAVAAFLVLTFTSVSPVFLILGAAALGLLFYR